MYYPVAIRILKDTCTGAKKLVPEKFYYFIKGVNIESVIKCDACRIEDEVFSIVLNNQDQTAPIITFSAVVGENGSGKSTLIELFIRIINNLGASLLGEIALKQGMSHLHYIDGIYAELYFCSVSNNIKYFYRICVQGRNVEVLRFSQNNDNEYIADVTPIFNNQDAIEPDYRSISPIRQYIPSKGEWSISQILGELAYIYVSNFSIYAYNPYDFRGEETSIAYERICRKTGSMPLKYSEQHWLEGLFHRRESYQTPIVLYPARTNGNIDITKEKHLAYLRFFSVIISNKSKFRKINEHLDIESVSISGINISYDVKYIRSKANYRFNQNGYQKLRTDIISLWNEITCLENKEPLENYAKKRKFGDNAINYLIYKTLKVSSTYPRYAKYFHSKYERATSVYKKEDLKKLIYELAKDVSHVTRKIRQTLFYLIYGLYDVQQEGGSIPIDDLSDLCNDLNKSISGPYEDKKTLKLRRYGIEDFTPPPFVNAELEIFDKATKQRVLFATLSSGEKQYIYSITGIIYHLVNLDSVDDSEDVGMTIYKNINVILEEIELYFHPDLQRKMVKAISDGILQCSFQHIRNIHVLMVTHSPFILSDIPSRNVLALNKDGDPASDDTTRIQTFGGNIHDILRDPFFLKNGVVGEIAKETINYTIKEIENLRFHNQCQEELRGKIGMIINLIDEPIIHKILYEDYMSLLNVELNEVERLEKQIAELEKKKEKLLNKK